jgi:hypothetical protein
MGAANWPRPRGHRGDARQGVLDRRPMPRVAVVHATHEIDKAIDFSQPAPTCSTSSNPINPIDPLNLFSYFFTLYA